MKKLITPFRVGLFLVAVVACFIGAYAFVHKGGLSKKDSVEVFAIFRDASGLEKKSSVEIAGISVGEITDISLYQGQLAKLTLRIKKQVHLHQDAAITKRSASLLGDNLIDLFPGSENSPDMPPGGQIVNVYDRNNMQEIFDSLNRITKEIEGVTKSLSSTLNGEQGSIQGIIASLQNTITQGGAELDETLSNLEQISGGLSGVVNDQKSNLSEIVENVKVASGEAARALGTVDQILGANKGDLKENFAGVRDALEKLNSSLQNIQQITDKIDQGKGTLGQLVNDNGIANKLEDTVSDASDFVDRLIRLQTQVSLRADYMLGEGNAKGYFDLKLIPRPDRYYLLGLVDDSRGSSSFVYQQNIPPVTGFQAAGQEQITTSRSLKFTAEFAQLWYFLTLRLGIIESTAGGGLDFEFWKDHLFATVDLFDFADYYQPYPRLRSYLTLRFLKHLEVRGGVDDIFNNPATHNEVAQNARGFSLGGRELFFGGGVYFTDEDLKAVLTVAPLPKF